MFEGAFVDVGAGVCAGEGEVLAVAGQPREAEAVLRVAGEGVGGYRGVAQKDNGGV
jgi:hypothetical protein